MPIQQPDLEKLIREYRKAQTTIIQDIVRLSQQKFPTQAAYKNALLQQINQKLAALQGVSTKWVEANIPIAYQEGLERANLAVLKQYQEAGVPPPIFPDQFAIVHQEAILSLVNGTIESFDGLILYTGRKAEDVISTAVEEIITQKIITGETVKQTQLRVMEALKDEGLTAVQFPNGRSMRLDAYGSLVARSTTAEATNQASMRQSLEVGGDLVKMTSHVPTCPICYPLQGRVYSITGQNTNYPKLEVAYSSGYANIHPNCKHRINPYIPALKTPAELKKDLEFSNRPIDVEDMSKAEQAIFNKQLEAYNEIQKDNSQTLYNRKLWERYLSRMGNEAPQSFSAFMRVKNDEESWKNLQSQYRTIGIQNKNEEVL